MPARFTWPAMSTTGEEDANAVARPAPALYTPTPGVAFVVAVLLLRRLPLMLLLHHVVPAIRGRREARFAGWFGPIGVAALYYATLSAERLQRHDFFIVGSLVVASSVVTHGVTATRLVQRRERIEPAEAPNGDHRPQSESA